LFQGSFASGTVFPGAPNPALVIDGAGQIGLPLSTRDAQAIVQIAQQAPFGHNERTIVDTHVRDTLEIDASKVHFTNPQFRKWLDTEVLQKVTADLGTQATDMTIELYKLLLYKERSQ
jgi:hypothetical protein